MKMNPRCSACGLVFDREPGYFLGAMMISYGISAAVCTIIFWLLGYVASSRPPLRIFETALLYLPVVPFVFRYSRIAWIYIDQMLDPEK
jgi:hypothetical protein